MMADSQEHPVLDSAELEMKKKRLLEELESALGGEKTITAQASSSLGLGIEVIDETALLDSVAKIGGSRRRKNNKKITQERPKSMTDNRRYSRKELEALRFVNMSQQRKFWKAIHSAFHTTVATEYDTLASTPLLHNKPILSVAATNGRWRYMNVFVH